MLKRIPFLLLILLCRNSFAQCNVDTTVNTFYHFLNPSVPGDFYGFLCAGQDSVGTTGLSGYYDGSGFSVNLESGTEVIFNTDSCNGNSVSMTIVDSANHIIPGAYSIPSCPNSLDFIATYSGKYSVVLNLNGVCGGAGTNLIGQVYVKIKSGTVAPACTGIPNDTICGAIRLYVDSFFASGNTNDAYPNDPMDTYLASIGATSCSPPNNTMWYYLYSPITIDTLNIWVTSGAGSGFHSWIVGLLANDTTDFCHGTFSYIGCTAGAADDQGIDTVSFQLFGVIANRYYIFMIDGYSGSTGPFSIGLRSQSFATIVNDLTVENFNIYPNPASDKLFIQSNSKSPDAILSLTDLTGKVIYRVKTKDLKQTILDVGNLSAGIYVVTLQTDGGTIQKKLCISPLNK